MKFTNILLPLLFIASIFAEENAIIKILAPEPEVYLCDSANYIFADIYTYLDFYNDNNIRRFTDYYLRYRGVDTTGGKHDTIWHHGLDLHHDIGEDIHAPFDCVLIRKRTQGYEYYDSIVVPLPESLRTEGGDTLMKIQVKKFKMLGYGNYAWYYAPGPNITFLIGHLNSQPSDPIYKTYNKGDIIATGGETGEGTGPHLHFEVLTGYQLYATDPAIRSASRVNPEPYYFNQTPSSELSFHFNLYEYEKQDTINDYTHDLSTYNFFDATYRTEKGKRCYKPYAVSEPIPNPGKYRVKIDVLTSYFDLDSIHFNSNHTQVTQTFGSDEIDTIAHEEREFKVLDCVVINKQCSGHVNGDVIDNTFDPNDTTQDCSILRVFSNSGNYLQCTSPQEAIYYATGEVLFTPGHSIVMHATLDSSLVSFSYSQDSESGTATWSISGPRSIMCSNSVNVGVSATDTIINKTSEIGLWFFQTLSHGVLKTNKSRDSTSLTFVCPYCPQHPNWEDDSWSRTGCQQTADMVMQIHPVLKYEHDIYNTDRSDYIVKEIMDFEVSDNGNNSFGYTGDIIGNDTYSWTQNGGFSNQSSFTLLDVDPSSYWYREWLCCRHIGEDCPCSNHHYEDLCGYDNECINIHAENFIFPPWEKEPVTAFARALTDSTDTTLKSTFHNMDSLMPGRALITRIFNDPDSVSKRLLLEIHGASPDMVIWAYPCTTDWPHQDRSSFDYETERIHVPYIEDEDTLETIAIPEDYQIPIIAKPNPFNTEVSISFELEHEENCVVSIYDIEGSLREVIFDGIVSSRSKTLSWQCSSCPSGTYFVVVTTPSTYSTKKISLVK